MRVGVRKSYLKTWISVGQFSVWNLTEVTVRKQSHMKEILVSGNASNGTLVADIEDLENSETIQKMIQAAPEGGD